MSLSESERSIIVKREMEKAERTFDRPHAGGEALQQIPPLIALGTMENPYSPLHSTTS